MWLELEEVMSFSNRSVHVCLHTPTCPHCNSEQVQIINAFQSPALWRCRHCRKKIEYEPETVQLTDGGGI